uniref:DUF19 domain-containing protein n=1 Tax=Trichuris muris TaxID=70415 RepID=A0A5S6QQR9_TRIMR
MIRSLCLLATLWCTVTAQFDISMYGVCTPMQQQYIRQCAVELKQLGAFGETPATTAIIWDHLRRTSKEYFVQMCNAYRRFEQCILPYKRQCWYAEPIKGELAVASEALAFACLEGFYGMLNNWDCLIRVLTMGEVTECEDRMAKDAKVLMTQTQDSGFFNAPDLASCRALQEFVNCIRYPIQGQCGEDAWQHVREAAQRQARVYLPYCILAGCHSKSSLSVLLLCIVLLYLLHT